MTHQIPSPHIARVYCLVYVLSWTRWLLVLMCSWRC